MTSPTIEYLFAIQALGFELPKLLDLTPAVEELDKVFSICLLNADAAYKEVEIDSMDIHGQLEPLNIRLPKFHELLKNKLHGRAIKQDQP